MIKFINHLQSKAKKMKTWVHILVSSVIAYFAYPIAGWKVLLIFVGGVMIDIDHYLWYIYDNKKFNMFECYNHFTYEAEKNGFKDVAGILMVFHTVDFLLAMVIISFFSQYALLFTIGLLPHYILDLIFILRVPKRFIVNHSIIYWVYKNKIQKI